jgi:dihydroxyacetone kinase-like protein
MEVGVGIHGEKGVSRQKRLSADALATMLVDEIARDLGLARGEEVVVLVNNLGAATMQELYVVYRRVFCRLREKGVGIHRALVGPFCTAQDMAGLSLSIMRLDDTLKRYMDAPACTLGWRQGA